MPRGQAWKPKTDYAAYEACLSAESTQTVVLMSFHCFTNRVQSGCSFLSAE